MSISWPDGGESSSERISRRTRPTGQTAKEKDAEQKCAQGTGNRIGCPSKGTLEVQGPAAPGVVPKKGAPMNPIPLTVMLHGLIALAPASNAGHMTALLLDERMASTESCMAMHSPKLTFSVPDVTVDCFNAGCFLSELKCTCTGILSRKKVWLEISPASTLNAVLPQGASPLPELPQEEVPANDISYIANLALPPFGQTLNPLYLGALPPDNLFARMDVPFESVTPCALAARTDKGESHIQSFGFYPLHGMGDANEMSQPISQMAVAEVPLGVDQGVTLHMSDFNGMNEKVVAVDPGDVVQLGNDTTPLDPDDPCEDGVGRHFAMYYDLGLNPPGMEGRLIPHARYSAGLPVDPNGENKFIPAVCKAAMANLDPMDRPVCPIAIFKP
jgi:hypothetical protein